MNNLKSFFPGFSLSNSDFRKVTKEDGVFLAALIPYIAFILFTDQDVENDSRERLRFVDPELYFKTEDGYLWRVFQKKFQNRDLWCLDSTMKQFEQYFFNLGEMCHFSIQTGRGFKYDKLKTSKVIDIILITSHKLNVKNFLKESDLVAQFNVLR